MLTEGTIQRDTVCWMGDSARYSPREFIYYSSLITGRVYCDSLITCDTLCGYWEEKGQGIYDKEGVSLIYENPHGDLNPLALSARVGRGRLILCSTPLLFTNYGMLDGRNGDFIFRMMSQFNGLPVVRTEAYLEKKLSQQSSPLSFFLTTPPLRWAVYLTLFGLLLFFVFTARRRQRVIPVMKNPDNKSLEFVCLIGTLYYQQRHHADLVRKKYLYFSETLRRELMIDVGNEAENRQNVELLSERTGLSRDTVDGYLRDVREAIAAESALKEAEMRRCIDEMNEILNKI
ncbi:MAG: hypothetical protein IJV27_12990 [Prevotella sp.]|nr:hypothetical protein [Prevotella sp.]